MFRINIERTLAADAESVFNALSDHESYPRYSNVSIAKVVEPGSEEKNGLGALRHMGGNGVELFERITVFERPRRLHYKIERAKPFGIEHLRGEITLADAGENRTRVVWESEGRIKLPLVGPLMDRQLQKMSERLFGSILRGVERELTRNT